MVVPLCVSEMQKTEYMVFAGRQYFLGDKCQVQKPQNVLLTCSPGERLIG